MHPGSAIGYVYCCTQPVDFRKQINGLAAIVEQELALPLFGDALFVFTNRRRDKIKALYWHRNGFCLWQKQLEKHRFAWPKADVEHVTCALSLKELEWLIEGFDLWRNKPHETLNYQAKS
jgi:transposase